MTEWLGGFLFIGAPYAAIVAVAIGIRMRLGGRLPSTALSPARFLEPRGTSPASALFHVTLGAVLAIHVAALLIPWPLRWWNGSPLRLYLLEWLTLAFGLIAGAGAVLLLVRRLNRPRLQRASNPADTVVLALLALQALTGVATGILFPWGTAWMTWAGSAYLVSVIQLRPAAELMVSAPWTLQLHFLNGLLLIALLPFTSLGHAVLFPIRWFFRPRIVYRTREDSRRG